MEFEKVRMELRGLIKLTVDTGEKERIYTILDDPILVRKEGDYQALENIFTKELGNAQDYEREYGDTPFGLLIRRVAKLEYDAAMKVFSEFINESSLNQQQIVFVKKIIDYVVENGYMENISELMKPPFDKPMSFVKLFDRKKQEELVGLIHQIKENATEVVG